MSQAQQLFNEAHALIEENYRVANENEAWNIFKALQLLVDANKIESSPSFLKAQIIMCMATCNFKIGNYTLAYNCALIAKNEIIKALSISPLDENSTKNLLGWDNCEDIIQAVKKETNNHVAELMESYVLTALDTTALRKIYPVSNNSTFSKQILFDMINVLGGYNLMLRNQAKISGNWEYANKAIQYNNLFRYPLLYIWEKYGFGTNDSFWEEDENMFPYQLMISQLNQYLPQLIDVLRTDSPFKQSEKNGQITNNLILIYKDALSKLHDNKI